MKTLVLIIIMLAGVVSAQNRIWSNGTYGKVDPREWMPESLYTNCVLWMPMNQDPTQFGTWGVPDGSSSKNNGGQTNVNSRPVWTNAANGALVFDGVDDGLDISANTSLSFMGTNGFSLVSWVKPTASTAAGATIFSKWKTDPSTTYPVNYGMSLSNARRISVSMAVTGAQNYYDRNGASIIPTTTWSMASVVYNPDLLSTNALKIFLNGSEDSYSYTDKNGSMTNLVILDKLTIGYRVYNTTAKERFSNGMLDGILIFNRALTSNEVAYIYNATKGAHGL